MTTWLRPNHNQMSDPSLASPTMPSPTPTGWEIRTEALIRTFGRRKVVNEVNISLRGGEIVGLLGPNGAGKTTTFYIIVGLIAATSGKVWLNQRDITRVPMYQRARLGLGYLPQEPSVFRSMSVLANLLAIAEIQPYPAGERRQIVQQHLEELNLTHLARQPAYTLSGGERRRLEISRALLCRPRFLLLDEPFSGVDPISVAEVQSIVVSLKEKGIGVLITDHNVRETLRICDRAYLLHDGKILSQGSSEHLINDPQSRRFYLGEGFTM